ncbi:C-type lectin lectoxin-Thr1-like [Carettochelys insculpta]|uniref:C-type lectin lectoxin-Thr1-like n=1 Tax=Carettochelys insculpta TaxID=44489 RepID=UPI003EBF137E
MGPVTCFSLGLLGFLMFSPSMEAAQGSVLSPRPIPSLGSGAGAASCFHDWRYYRGYCYAFFPEKKTWSEAEVLCQYYHVGAHLASILSEEEGQMVARQISEAGFKDSVWIGLHDPREHRRWRWTDRSLYSYKPWNTGEPNNDYNVEYCTELVNWRDYKNWNDKDCSTKNGFVCKYRP